MSFAELTTEVVGHFTNDQIVLRLRHAYRTAGYAVAKYSMELPVSSLSLDDVPFQTEALLTPPEMVYRMVAFISEDYLFNDMDFVNDDSVQDHDWAWVSGYDQYGGILQTLTSLSLTKNRLYLSDDFSAIENTYSVIAQRIVRCLSTEIIAIATQLFRKSVLSADEVSKWLESEEVATRIRRVTNDS